MLAVLGLSRTGWLVVGMPIGPAKGVHINIETDSPRVIQVYAPDGKYVREWRLPSLQKGEAVMIGAICVTTDGKAYIAAGGAVSATRIMEYDLFGKQIGGWQLGEASSGE
jgi:hypothetical protein